jgi:hypothetical protein
MIGTIPFFPSDPLGRFEVQRNDYPGLPRKAGKCSISFIDEGRVALVIHGQSKESLERLGHMILDLSQQ